MIHREPTLFDVPGILLRSILRTVARLLFLVGALLLICGLFLGTWRSARSTRQQQALDAALLALDALKRLRQNA